MNLHEIETNLKNPDFHCRLKAIAALKDYDAEVSVPLLAEQLHDPEFLVRSFVARGLGSQQTAESYAALLQLTKFDNTPNVRAEAANSLSLFGKVSAAHLVQTFFQDDHWLVRRSILAALVELDCPEELLEVCGPALSGDDPAVQEEAVDALGTLANTRQNTTALAQLLTLSKSPAWRIRQHAAYALKRFDQPTAKAALNQLRQDDDHRVAGAALEDLLP